MTENRRDLKVPKHLIHDTYQSIIYLSLLNSALGQNAYLGEISTLFDLCIILLSLTPDDFTSQVESSCEISSERDIKHYRPETFVLYNILVSRD